MPIAQKIRLLFTSLLLLPSLLFPAAPHEATQTNEDANTLAVFYTINGNIENEYNTLAEKQLKKIGFNVTDAHKRVNDQYKVKWGSTVLDVLSFMPVVNDKNIMPLLNIDPRIAGFAPFNMLIYKKLDENVTHVGHLSPKAMLDILGIDNEEVREKFINSFKPLDEMIEKEFKDKGLTFTKSYMPYKKMPEKRMINFEYEFEEPDDMDDFIDDFQNTFELAFIDKEYLIAGQHNFMDATDDAEDILKDYSAFWTYSLCHLEYSYGMFDGKDGRPEAGLFAPCTMYMYVRKGTNTLVVGMYTLSNWSDTLGITDKTKVALVQKLEKQIPEILTAYGMKAVSNVNPLTHSNKSMPKIPVLENTKVDDVSSKVIAPSTSKTPSVATLPIVNTKKMDQTNVGEIIQGKISAYLRGEFLDVKTVEEKLKAAGFDIIASVPLDNKGKLTSIVFTSKALTSMANKENRGFMASLRVLIDSKEKRISIINPLYLAKGFMQNDFDENTAKETLNSLKAQFDNLENSKDMLEFKLLPKYQFMTGMPYYEDMIEVASGDALLEKIKNNKKVLFIQKIDNGATLIGVQLERGTNRFISRIGGNNAAMLPYPILIEDGKAKILDPKYYIAFMYPMLTMSDFMTIASTPGAIIKDCEKIFK